jgi:DNA-binding transcriptional regulator YdaS (Cro superfamily)
MSPLTRAIAIFDGNQAALARASGALPQEIHRWVRRGRVPPNRCQAIVDAVRQEIPRALERGLSEDLAQPLALSDLNQVFPANDADAGADGREAA